MLPAPTTVFMQVLCLKRGRRILRQAPNPLETCSLPVKPQAAPEHRGLVKFSHTTPVVLQKRAGSCVCTVVARSTINVWLVLTPALVWGGHMWSKALRKPTPSGWVGVPSTALTYGRGACSPQAEARGDKTVSRAERHLFSLSPLRGFRALLQQLPGTELHPPAQ